MRRSATSLIVATGRPARRRYAILVTTLAVLAAGAGCSERRTETSAVTTVAPTSSSAAPSTTAGTTVAPTSSSAAPSITAGTTAPVARPIPRRATGTTQPAGSTAPPAAVPPATTTTTPLRQPIVATYYFYWYNAATGLHLKPTDPLPTHPVPEPATSYASAAWHRHQLADMSRALIDVVLPVYWGEAADPWELWSGPGISTLVEARRQMVAEGLLPPRIGMFFDTNAIVGLDLTRPENIRLFYTFMRDFFTRVPPEHRATIHGKPIVWLFAPQKNAYDQRVFDRATESFRADFGVDPYIVRDVAWTNVVTSATFPWSAAQNGMLQSNDVAVAGPGYDERQVPGRRGVYRDRDGGNWYRTNLTKALESGRPFIAIETWNEFHEASGVGESVEYGRTYIEMTRELVGRFRGN